MVDANQGLGGADLDYERSATMLTIVTHGDLDGWAAGYIARRIFEKTWLGSCKVVYANHDNVDCIIQQEINDNIADKHLMVLDITPSTETMSRMDGYRVRVQNKKERVVVLLDHHKSAKEVIESYPLWGRYYADVCAAKGVMRYAEFATKSMPADIVVWLQQLASVVNAWDSWLLDDPDRTAGEALNRVYGLVGPGEMDHAWENGAVALDVLATVLGADEEKYVAKWVKTMTRDAIFVDQQDRKYMFIVAERFASSLGNKLCLEFNLDYVAIYNPTRKAVELRSVGECDVGEIAKAHGGGGHKNAAGYSVDINPTLFVQGRKDIIRQNEIR